MRSSSRRSDDADVIRARLRALLDDGDSRRGWVPTDDLDDLDDLDNLTDFDDLSQRPETGPPNQAPTTREAEDDSARLPHGMGRHRSPGRAVRWDPGRGGARSLWVAGLLAAVLLVGWTWLDRPQVEKVPVEPAGAGPSASATASPPATPSVGEVAETSATLVVSVVGLVGHPGLVTLTSGARVADAVKAAGGLLPEADPASLNLAAVVSDGQQVAVGVPGASAVGAPGAGGAKAGPVSGGRLNLNSATVGDLDALPGIGPVLAERIVAHRTAEGPFTSIDQLDDVPGIGPAIATKLAELVTV